ALGMGLVIGSLKDLVKVFRVHTRRRRVQQSDAYILAQGSRLPAAAWLTLFAFVIIVCARASARVLYSAVTTAPAGAGQSAWPFDPSIGPVRGRSGRCDVGRAGAMSVGPVRCRSGRCDVGRAGAIPRQWRMAESD